MDNDRFDLAHVHNHVQWEDMSLSIYFSNKVPNTVA